MNITRDKKNKNKKYILEYLDKYNSIYSIKKLRETFGIKEQNYKKFLRYFCNFERKKIGQNIKRRVKIKLKKRYRYKGIDFLIEEAKKEGFIY